MGHSGFLVATSDQDAETMGLGISLLGLDSCFAVKPEEVQFTLSVSVFLPTSLGTMCIINNGEWESLKYCCYSLILVHNVNNLNEAHFPLAVGFLLLLWYAIDNTYLMNRNLVNLSTHSK